MRSLYRSPAEYAEFRRRAAAIRKWYLTTSGAWVYLTTAEATAAIRRGDIERRATIDEEFALDGL